MKVIGFAYTYISKFRKKTIAVWKKNPDPGMVHSFKKCYIINPLIDMEYDNAEKYKH